MATIAHQNEHECAINRYNSLIERISRLTMPLLFLAHHTLPAWPKSNATRWPIWDTCRAVVGQQHLRFNHSAAIGHNKSSRCGQAAVNPAATQQCSKSSQSTAASLWFNPISVCRNNLQLLALITAHGTGISSALVTADFLHNQVSDLAPRDPAKCSREEKVT